MFYHDWVSFALVRYKKCVSVETFVSLRWPVADRHKPLGAMSADLQSKCCHACLAFSVLGPCNSRHVAGPVIDIVKGIPHLALIC